MQFICTVSKWLGNGRCSKLEWLTTKLKPQFFNPYTPVCRKGASTRYSTCLFLPLSGNSIKHAKNDHRIPRLRAAPLQQEVVRMEYFHCWHPYLETKENPMICTPASKQHLNSLRNVNHQSKTTKSPLPAWLRSMTVKLRSMNVHLQSRTPGWSCLPVGTSRSLDAGVESEPTSIWRSGWSRGWVVAMSTCASATPLRVATFHERPMTRSRTPTMRTARAVSSAGKTENTRKEHNRRLISQLAVVHQPGALGIGCHNYELLCWGIVVTGYSWPTLVGSVSMSHACLPTWRNLNWWLHCVSSSSQRSVQKFPYTDSNLEEKFH